MERDEDKEDLKIDKFHQLDLFLAEVTDLPIRDLMDLMWRPFFSLSKRKRFKPIIYENKGVKITITGGEPYGIATIYDEDILMWFASQIVEARDRGEQTSPQLHFTPYDCLKEIHRRTDGDEYNRFYDALERLKNTNIFTNIREEDQEGNRRGRVQAFSWISEYKLHYVEKNGKKIPKGVTVILPDWFYKGVLKKGHVLTIDDRYFKLTSGLERALYKIARKHVGRQASFAFTMRQLYEKTGSYDNFFNFALRIRKCVNGGGMPEYAMEIYKNANKEEVVTFIRRCELDFKDPNYEPPRWSKKQDRLLPKKRLSDAQ